jgi:hypothetical protein
MSSNSGLIQIDQQSFQWRIYRPEDGLQNRIFNPGVCFKSQNEEMYFGGISGFNHFHPHEIQVNPHPPPVAITSFRTATQEKQTNLLEGINSLKFTKKDQQYLDQRPSGKERKKAMTPSENVRKGVESWFSPGYLWYSQINPSGSWVFSIVTTFSVDLINPE